MRAKRFGPSCVNNALDDYFMKILTTDIENFSESDREPD